jgi:hypothetical protein
MPCEPYIENGRVKGFFCSRSRKPRPVCYVCGRPAKYFCDHRTGMFSTCDKPMCAEHRYHVADDTDYCAEHYNEFSICLSNQREIRLEQLRMEIERRNNE